METQLCLSRPVSFLLVANVAALSILGAAAQSIEGILEAPNGDAYDFVGFSLALDGEYLIAGAPGDDDVGGSAYIFELVGNEWIFRQRLLRSTPQSNTFFRTAFGHAVAIDDNTAVVGDEEIVHVFRRSADSWFLETHLYPSGNPGETLYGTSVAIHDGIIAVAARRTGFVHVYERVNGIWQETSTIDLPGSGGKHIEMPLEIEDELIVVGRALGVSNPSNGTVFVYGHSPGGWLLQAELTSAVTGDNFGARLDLAGDLLYIGAPGTDGDFENEGAVYIYRKAGTAWTLEEQLGAPEPRVWSFFGGSIASAGDLLVIGSSADITVDSSPYAVFTYQFENDQWQRAEKLELGNVDGNHFGFSVVADGNRYGIGARGCTWMGFEFRDRPR